MNPNTDSQTRNLTTADLARAGARTRAPQTGVEDDDTVEREAAERSEQARPTAAAPSEKLEALFTPDAADQFRTQWTNIQSRFVDDPRQAVRDGDELVAQVMKSLAESFAHERDRVEGQMQDGGDASTELLRVALRRYRSFFERLLTL
jgi:hypothetical protein